MQLINPLELIVQKISAIYGGVDNSVKEKEALNLDRKI
jgi:hypothetical protein